jgi:hypothetical protein
VLVHGSLPSSFTALSRIDDDSIVNHAGNVE